ncbi:MAG: histidinol-phosphate transaminase [Anaerolineae bacterium]|nr:histidinol-phosphate transaminase [Anaerolineae bacterium]
MSNLSSLQFNPHVATSPIYVGGASIESIKKEYNLDDVIKLASNESPLAPSPLAIKAIQEAAANLNRYPPMGDESLREVLAETIGRGTTPDHFVTGNGGCDVLSMMAASFLKQGDEGIICRPTFPVYEITAQRVGARMVYADLNPDHFTYDVKAILGAVTERTRLIYICNPNNPTGTTMTATQMEMLVNNAPTHVLIVADEAYHDFVTAGDYPDTLAHVLQGKNVAILHSFSKAYSLAGLRLGYAIAPPEIARYLSRARESFHLSQLVFAAGIASLRDRAHLEKMVALTLSGRAWLSQQLTNLRLPVWPSQSNFILFKPPFPAALVSERLLQRGVIVRPMSQFYLPAYLRVTVGLPEENERFIAALQESLAAMEAEGVAKEVATEESRGEFKF